MIIVLMPIIHSPFTRLPAAKLDVDNLISAFFYMLFTNTKSFFNNSWSVCLLRVWRFAKRLCHCFLLTLSPGDWYFDRNTH